MHLVQPKPTGVSFPGRIFGTQSNDVDDKTNAIAKDIFDRIKASAHYGYGATFYYTCILPLKGFIFGLNDNEKEKLSYYTAHATLYSEIERVQYAFWEYVYTVEGIGGKVAGPTAIDAGEWLVHNYDNLFRMAKEIVKDVLEKQGGADKDEEYLKKFTLDYLNNLEGVLLRNTRHTPYMGERTSPEAKIQYAGNLFETVNSLRASLPLEKALRGQKELNKQQNDPDILKQTLSNHYSHFVQNFVSHVQEVSSKATVSKHRAITEASIQGLAAIPELGDGLILLGLWDQLNQQVNQEEAELIQSLIKNIFEQEAKIRELEGAGQKSALARFSLLPTHNDDEHIKNTKQKALIKFDAKMERQQQKIVDLKNQLKTNQEDLNGLAEQISVLIAQKVTMAVGRKIVETKTRILTKNIQGVEGINPDDVEVKLRGMLDRREKKEENKNTLYDLLSVRLEMRTPVQKEKMLKVELREEI